MELIIGALVGLVTLLTVWIVILKRKNGFYKVLVEMQDKVLIDGRDALEEAVKIVADIKKKSVHLEEVEVATKPKRPRGRPRKNV